MKGEGEASGDEEVLQENAVITYRPATAEDRTDAAAAAKNTAAATKKKVSAAKGKVSAAKAAAPKAAKGKPAAKAAAPKATKGKAAAPAAASPVKKAIAKKRRGSGRMTAADSKGAMETLMGRNFDAASMSILRALS